MHRNIDIQTIYSAVSKKLLNILTRFHVIEEKVFFFYKSKVILFTAQ